MKGDGMTAAGLTATQIASGYDLMSRKAIVTGGASGLGLEVVRALAIADATIVVTSPDVGHARAVIGRLQQEIEGSTISVAELDLTSLLSIRRFVLEYISTAQPLSLLIHAERQLPTSTIMRTVDGFESLFGHQHMGHFALTAGMMSALRRSAGSRVISLTSAGHVLADVDLDDPNFLRRDYDPWIAYGQAQSASALFAEGFRQHFAAEGISCNVADPGDVPPDILLDLQPLQILDHGWANSEGEVNADYRDVSTAASTIVWGALAAELDGQSGKYLHNCQIASALSDGSSGLRGEFRGYLPRVLDPVRALDLWDLSERLMRGVGGW